MQDTLIIGPKPLTCIYIRHVVCNIHAEFIKIPKSGTEVYINNNKMLKHILSVMLYTICIVAQLSTVRHTGTSTGEEKVVDGINIYHAYAASKSNDNAILFLTDIFGLKLPANRLLADSYARAGYLVLMPDYFKGDPQPEDRTGFNQTAWRERHQQEEVTQTIEKTINYARNTLGVKKLGAVGYCFGGSG